ncbi:Dna-J like membrane chaperone protein [Catenovulum agarivorans DS-2]|uniref:Co-chaperone protein DjlA n=1 Tax=Catenovulum agarivorans DS-2 TaxID=1328313 RepID=W7QUZ2_9ALTE|nr:co-chaperone DjlA [Catenovulum agarivorans]EWH09105.1 Dna-J like membrane chaperone protein [Catenovulum agarivorans DS-2]
MHYWGKVLGFIFGFMMFKLPGALLGVIIGYYFDKGYAKALADNGGFARLLGSRNNIKNRVIFFHTLFSIMGHIAKSSGRVTENDIALASALMDKMGLTGALRQEAQNAYRSGKQADFPVAETVKEFKQYCFGRRDFMAVYFEIQLQAALANGQLHQNAKRVLTKIGKTLGFSAAEVETYINQAKASSQYQQQTHHSHSQSDQQQLSQMYQILGVDAGASDQAVKKAYKKLMSQHHPDKLASQGLPEQALSLAKERAQQIQAAYEYVKKSRGLS